jgi:hypothetical protein
MSYNRFRNSSTIRTAFHIFDPQVLFWSDTFQFLFYRKQPVNPIQRFLCTASGSTVLRWQAVQCLAKLAPQVRPASAKSHIRNIMAAGITVCCMQASFESPQKIPGMFSKSHLLIFIQNAWWPQAAGAIQPNI